MDDFILLKKYTLNYLSKYDSSKKNLERIVNNKIRRMTSVKKDRFFLYNKIKEFLLELEEKKILDDKKYSNNKIRNFSIQGKSKIFIYNYLLQKGINKKLIEIIFEEFELANPNWEMASAEIFAKKKRLGLNSEINKEKDLAKMARAGFNYNMIKKILKFNY